MKRVIIMLVLSSLFIGGCASHKNVRYHKKKRKGNCNCSKWSYNPSGKEYQLQPFLRINPDKRIIGEIRFQKNQEA